MKKSMFFFVQCFLYKVKRINSMVIMNAFFIYPIIIPFKYNSNNYLFKY